MDRVLAGVICWILGRCDSFVKIYCAIIYLRGITGGTDFVVEFATHPVPTAVKRRIFFCETSPRKAGSRAHPAVRPAGSAIRLRSPKAGQCLPGGPMAADGSLRAARCARR